MINLKRATMQDFEKYKFLYENAERWLLSERSKAIYLYHLTRYQSKKSIEELKKFLNRFHEYTVEHYMTDLSKDYMYMYIVEEDGKLIGFVELDYSHTAYETGVDGRRYKANFYHIYDCGLMKTATYAQREEVIRQITELELPLMHELQVWADSDMAKIAFEANGFTQDGSFYIRTWTKEEMQARKKRKRKG